MTLMRNCLSRANANLVIGIFSFCFLAVTQDGLGQNRCAVSDHTYHESPEQFENWLKKLNLGNAERTNNEVLIIPVVFHIIHQGEPVGQGQNLSFERVQQQMATLNEDFRRTNTDASATPEAFQAVAADVAIEFVLAKQDPLGLPTNGITRTIGRQASYRFTEDDILKSEIYWPAEDYMNIYVSNLEGFLGWASFPFSNLAGIDIINNDRLTDGVALDFEYVGVNPDASEFESLGRTATHEVGHFLGLKHVWGDGGCNDDDFCADTPLSNTSYQRECPAGEVVSCSSSDMYSNFLNYTDDACMNLFTICQRERMRTVVTNSIRRKSLLTSKGLDVPVMIANDLGINNIENMNDLFCSTNFSPQVGIRNFGINSIDEMQIIMLLDGVSIDTLSANPSLASGEASILGFSPISLENITNQSLVFQVYKVNGIDDQNKGNNVLEVIIPPAIQSTLPYTENFESINTLITRTELSENSLWQRQTAPYTSSTDMGGQLNFFNNTENLGEFHYLMLPNMNLASVNSATLSFRYAYSGVSGNESKDGLLLMASQDCGVTFDQVLFSRYGDDLITVNRSISSSFTPTGPDDWQEVELNITSILNPNLRFAFVGQNGAQNNIYIDDIQVVETELQAYDIGITEVIQLPVVTCSNFIAPRITIENFGFETISSYNLQFDVSGTTGQSVISTELVSGAVETNSIAISDLEAGTYSVTLSANGPNQENDLNTSNNTYTRNIIINDEEATLPIRETFDQPDQWVTVNPTGNSIWTTFGNGEGLVRAAAFASGNLGDEHWLVSPVLNTANLTEGTLQFRMAHAQNGTALDRLQVFLSVNCGQSYDQLIYDKSGETLSTTTSSDEFIPGSDDWRVETIDISEYVVWNNLRLAFVFTNGGGNHLYIDEAEVFTVRPEFLRTFEIPMAVFPNPTQDSFTVTVDMPQKEEVVVSLVNMSGKVIAQFREPNGLNQTYQFQVSGLWGVYLVNVTGNNFETSRRVIIRK